MSEKDHEENFDQLLGIRQSNGEFKWSEWWKKIKKI
jgi:hypothetical protein